MQHFEYDVHVKIHALCDIMLSWVDSFQHLKWSWGLQLQDQAAKKNDFLDCLSLKDETSRLSWNVGN